MPSRRSLDRDPPTAATAIGLARAWLAIVVTLCAPALHPDIRLDNEIALGSWSPSRTLYRRDVPVCISNGGSDGNTGGRFRLIAQGEAPASFALSNAIQDTIPYALGWTRNANSNSVDVLTPGVPSERSYAFRRSSSCKDGKGPGLRLVIESTAIDAAPPGIYDDLLQLTIVVE